MTAHDALGELGQVLYDIPPASLLIQGIVKK